MFSHHRTPPWFACIIYVHSEIILYSPKYFPLLLLLLPCLVSIIVIQIKASWIWCCWGVGLAESNSFSLFTISSIRQDSESKQSFTICTAQDTLSAAVDIVMVVNGGIKDEGSAMVNNNKIARLPHSFEPNKLWTISCGLV